MALVQAAVAAIAQRGEAAIADLHGSAGASSLFVLTGQGEPLALPLAASSAAAAALPNRERLLEIGDSEAGRGWLHDRIANPAAASPLWRSTYVERVLSPKGSPLLVGRSQLDSPIENAFLVQQVQEAAALIARRGRAAFPALRDRQGRFVFREVYIFVLDANGVELVNPLFPALEGRNLIALQDAEGKEVIRDELLLALRNGSGWTAALWPDPRSGKPSRKISYVSRVTTPEGEILVVGAGVNEPLAPPLGR